jgi:hypothetical protein
MEKPSTSADTARLAVGSLFGALVATLTMTWVLLPHLAFAFIAVPLIALSVWGASLYRIDAKRP